MGKKELNLFCGPTSLTTRRLWNSCVENHKRISTSASIQKVSLTIQFIKWMAFKPKKRQKVFCKSRCPETSMSQRRLGSAQIGHLRITSSHQWFMEGTHPQLACVGTSIHVTFLWSWPQSHPTIRRIAKVKLISVGACSLAPTPETVP